MAGVEGDPSISTQEAGESGLALLPLGAAARGTQSGSSLAAPSGTVRTHTSPAVSGGSASKRSGASAHLSSSSSSSAHRSPQQPAAVVIPGAASATISGMDEGDGPQTVEERLDAGGEGEGEEVEWPEDDIVPEELMDSPDAPLLLPSAASPSSFSVHVRSPKGTLTSRVAGASKAGSTASGQKQKTVSLQGGGNSSTARSGERPVSALEAERERGQTGTNRSASLLSRGAQTVSAGFRSLAKAVGFGLSSSSSRGGQMKRKQSEEGEEEVDVEGFGFGPPRGAGEMTGRNGNGGVTVRSRLLGSDAGSPVVSVSSCRVNSAVDMSSPSFTEGEGAFPSDASGTSIPASSPWFGASSVIGQPQQLSPLHQGTPGSRDDQRRIHLSEGDGSKVFKGKSRMTEKETTKGDDKEEESPTKRATMV
uniref:Uncharacterized protein n=1 Tax=Chromera velia CCMP2878 TaxID=1169474 RepID=A0A0G4I6Z5_9ALVE|eukprot:Cvel_1929.t1-p1 / transcript=Cvel_1929.t1 / gene=Cvel_1929 / organism=Chromera_velia_CCMP2878 / gene_product=hypothetical protein / transcript_product=hypothetical protein / location=Cvel_scaffold72:100971-102233(-) / protein_length=421 / sequence_SO=supercontig / SO=protein_coding / is_pseudo=false